jgi:hypothetical protein
MAEILGSKQLKVNKIFLEGNADCRGRDGRDIGQKGSAHRFSSYRLNLQALITLTAFSSSSLRLRFIFLSLASLMASLSSFLILLFWSSPFCSCLGPDFFQPYHYIMSTFLKRIGLFHHKIWYLRTLGENIKPIAFISSARFPSTAQGTCCSVRKTLERNFAN